MDDFVSQPLYTFFFCELYVYPECRLFLLQKAHVGFWTAITYVQNLEVLSVPHEYSLQSYTAMYDQAEKA